VQNWVLFLSGTACLTSIFVLANKEVVSWNLMLIYPLIGIGVSLIFYATIKSHGKGFAKLLNSKVVVYLGKISYGLYVYHILSLVLATNLSYQMGFSLNSHITLLLGFVIAIIISVTSYTILETPFLILKKKFSLIPSRPI
jgi:peptidoglycan/LPS O-acetylase OafA/YrhL